MARERYTVGALTKEQQVLVASCLNWAREVVSRNRNAWWVAGHDSVEDAYQAAHFGLVLAAQRFDPSRGIKFTTYSTAWIINSLQRHASNGKLIRNPVRRTAEERDAHPPVLAALVSDREDGRYLDSRSESREPEPDARLVVAELLKRVNGRSRRVLVMRYIEGMTLAEIAGELGVTKERVRQISVAALAKVRCIPRAKKKGKMRRVVRRLVLAAKGA
jgi:RNA polymerase sigma factor (sigma-70 family)